MRIAPEHADSRALVETATAALEHCVEDLDERGAVALASMFVLDELAQAHLRHLTAAYVAERGPVEGAHRRWAAGGQFLRVLMRAYRAALDAGSKHPLQSRERLELMVRQLRCAGNLLKWQALAYYPADADLWREVVSIYRAARDERLETRQVGLRKARGAHTSIERELARLMALEAAALDQLAPMSIDVADRVLRYALPAFRLSAMPVPGSMIQLSLDRIAPPRKVEPDLVTAGEALYLWCGEAVSALEELAGVVARGLVPTVLSSGPDARETVLAVVHHLRRLWATPRRERRFRRHALSGKLRALLGFQRVQLQLAAGVAAEPSFGEWDMRDVSRNGIGILVPPGDCERISVGDMLGVQAEDGESWHVGIVRRIVRSEGGDGIVGLETVAKSVTAASVDNGQALSDVLVCDPVRRGASVRLAHSAGESAAAELVFLSHAGRVCKLRRLSTLARGAGYELSSYHVL